MGLEPRGWEAALSPSYHPAKKCWQQFLVGGASSKPPLETPGSAAPRLLEFVFLSANWGIQIELPENVCWDWFFGGNHAVFAASASRALVLLGFGLMGGVSAVLSVAPEMKCSGFQFHFFNDL